MGEFELLQMEPHTAAKHLILKRYLNAWFAILGSREPRITYIDGFAGPGEYKDGEKGSPIIAIESALAHHEKGTLSPNVEINFAFIEDKTEHANHLRNCLSSLTIPSSFNVEVFDGEFSNHVGGILDQIEKDKSILAPTFAFVDPFGFSGIPFELMARILKFRKCEVFINIMVDHINRFLEHPDDKVVAHFPVTFGTNKVLEIPNQPGNRVDLILNLYRDQLKKHANFVGRFDMHGKTDRKKYSLFFASNGAKGYEKMKGAYWSVDKDSGGRFSDADIPSPQRYLFETIDDGSLWNDMLAHFGGQTVPMTEVDKFVIEKTVFLGKHIRTLLKEHDKEHDNQGDISVIPALGYNRRKGTFKSDKVSIQFPAAS